VVVSAGRKRKVVQQTFAIYEGNVRVAQNAMGFRRVKVVLCDHLPAMQDGDMVVFNAPSQQLVGEADVIEHRHIRTSEGMKTALVIHLDMASEQEVGLGG
jgi:hypothetical protein